MSFDDLRSFIDAADKLGEVKVLEGTDWNEEIGAITQWQAQYDDSPLLLFDKIKGYKPGFRVASNVYRSPARTALALGLPAEIKGLQLVNEFRKRMQDFKPVPPVQLDTGPIKENVITGKDIDLFMFPTPKWNEADGGRYIGTGNVVIARDPEIGWINVGCYRTEIHDKNIATIYNSPGKDMDIIRKKYWAKGQGCPAVCVCGEEPILWGMASQKFPFGQSEYDYTGFVKGKPVEVVKGVTVDLPIPATSEIALEGEVLPPEAGGVVEGPFGEWTGYYGSEPRKEPLFKVSAILHRNNPILQGAPPTRGFYSAFSLAPHIIQSAILWNWLDRSFSGVRGVWCCDETGAMSIVIVSLKQMFSGHAKQIALAAAAFRSFHLGFVIMVDDDIDPSNFSEVLWAMGLRCDPERSIDIIRDMQQSALMPALPLEKRERGELTRGAAIINACRPYFQMAQGKYPKECRVSAELLEQVKQRWGKMLPHAR